MDARMEVVGLADFRRDLRRVPKAVARQVAVAHQQVARKVAATARARMARQPIPKAARAAAGIHSTGSGRHASITLAASNPFVRAAEFGTVLHTVFGRRMPAARMRRRVWRPYTGNQWRPKEGPAPGVGYAVHPTIRQEMPLVVDMYGDRILEGFAVAFPRRL